MKNSYLKIIQAIFLFVLLNDVCFANNYIFNEISADEIIIHDGFGMTVAERHKAFLECKTKTDVRGEYETKEEFEKRKKLRSGDCDDLKRLRGSYIEKKLFLKYNADNEEFTFKILDGLISLPKEKFSAKSLVLGYKFYDSNCPDKSSYSRKGSTGISRGVQAANIMKSGTSTYSHDFDCEYSNALVDKNFFGNALAIVTVRAIYPGQNNCECQKSVFDCERAYCPPNDFGRIRKDIKLQIKAKSPINKARLIKSMENSLYIRLYGMAKFWDHKEGYLFFIDKITIFNKETNKELLTFH